MLGFITIRRWRQYGDLSKVDRGGVLSEDSACITVVVRLLLLDPSRKMPEGVSMDVYNNDFKLENSSVGLIRENRDQ